MEQEFICSLRPLSGMKYNNASLEYIFNSKHELLHFSFSEYTQVVNEALDELRFCGEERQTMII